MSSPRAYHSHTRHRSFYHDVFNLSIIEDKNEVRFNRNFLRSSFIRKKLEGKWKIHLFAYSIGFLWIMVFMGLSSFSSKFEVSMSIGSTILQWSSTSPSAVSEQPSTKIPGMWRKPNGEGIYQCIAPPKSNNHSKYTSNGYLLVNANGGLNQIRMGICDMVAITRITNATLVMPYLDNSSFWSDSSEFKDIYDWEHLMVSLRDDISIVEKLPMELAKIKPFKFKAKSFSKVSFYENEVVDMLKKNKVVEIMSTHARREHNATLSIQKLRCLANYEALQYTQQIHELGSKLVHRLREDNQPYIALHLRYEKDMLAFTGCYHNLTSLEIEQLKTMRNKTRHWETKRPIIQSEQKRLEGNCPLTPHETALFLKALGYAAKSTKVYIVAGEFYRNSSMDEFVTVFPNTFTHSILATTQELEPFRRYQNRLAALDHVALESDVFIYTHDGHMAKVVEVNIFKDKEHRLIRLCDFQHGIVVKWLQK